LHRGSGLPYHARQAFAGLAGGAGGGRKEYFNGLLGQTCPQQGLAVGFCGEIDATIQIHIFYFYYEYKLSESENGLGQNCFAIVGATDQLLNCRK
jgi:hypothetical protein